MATQMSDTYFRSILHRERVDTGPLSPVRGVQNRLTGMLQLWAGQSYVELTPSGSFAKGTANASGTDIDLFLSLPETHSGTLKEIHQSLFLLLSGAGYNPRRQNVSLGIRVGAYDVDLVPARKHPGFDQDHSIYRRKADTWTKTNIAKHISHVVASARQDEIRIIKLWRNQKGIDFPSFYLELTVIEALRNNFGTSGDNPFALRIMMVLQYIRDSILTARVVDPANGSNVISDDLTFSEKWAVQEAARKAIADPSWTDVVK